MFYLKPKKIFELSKNCRKFSKVLTHQKSMWYSEIEVSLGRSLKKLKVRKKSKKYDEEKENEVVYGLPAEGKKHLVAFMAENRVLM